MYVFSVLPMLMLCSFQNVDGQRRTAPRKTTLAGGTYGTETFPTPAPTTPYLTTTQSSAQKSGAAQVPPAVPAPQLPAAIQFPAGFPQVPLQPPGFPASGLPPLPPGFGVPLAGGVMSIPGAIQLPSPIAGAVQIPSSAVRRPVIPLTTTTEGYGEDAKLLPIMPGDKTPVVSLCEEVEYILPPGTTQEECFTGDAVQLRYWQPYRALRTIKCRSGNDTAPPKSEKDRCAAAYKGATCIQRYQQFVVLAAMGPAASGWSCVRLGSGCSCSVRERKRLRMTDFEQRTDLREFMRS